VLLSHSSANLLRSCQQKFYFYKKDIPRDADYEESMEALDVGSSFHYVLEHCGYEASNISTHLKEAKKMFNLNPHNIALVHAMVLYYIKFHKKTKMITVALEKGIQNDFIIGYIDVIEKDIDGNWYIVDLKTTSYVNEFLKVKIQRDPQLLIYASFAKELAKYFDLDIKKFQGCHYRAVFKPKYVQGRNEKYGDYVKRLMKTVKLTQIFVPYNEKIIAETLAEHKRLEQLGNQIVEDKITPAKNFAACFDFYKPCQYISKCYGKTYTDMEGMVSQDVY